MSSSRLLAASAVPATLYGARVTLHTFTPLHPVDEPAALGAVYREVAAALHAQGHVLLHEKALGELTLAQPAAEARATAFAALGHPGLPPATFVLGRPCRGGRLAGLQVWSVEATADVRVEVVHAEGRALGSRLTTPRGVALFLNAVTAPPPEGPAPRDRVGAYRALFERADAQLAANGFTFHHVARTWLFVDRLLDDYDDLNRARTAFFVSRGLLGGDHPTFLPASTGIGGGHPAGAACQLDVLALRPEAAGEPVMAPIRSSRQDAAFNYGSAFSRGMSLGAEPGAPLLVSGTASIEPSGRTVYVGDVQGQLVETYLDVAAVLRSEGAGFPEIATAIRYHKDDACWKMHGELTALGLLPALPALDVFADVCRPELLFEMEVTAVRPSAAAGALDRLQALRDELRRFEEERDWARYHAPKNLVMALTAEVGELVEHFRWATEAESDALPPEALSDVRREIGDVIICLVQLCERLGIDPLDAAREKLELVRRKYPADRVRGKALKYTAYVDPSDSSAEEVP